MYVSSDKRFKFDPKLRKCIFLGCIEGIKGFKFWDSKAKKMVISRNAVFSEAFMLKVSPDEENISLS